MQPGPVTGNLLWSFLEDDSREAIVTPQHIRSVPRLHSCSGALGRLPQLVRHLRSAGQALPAGPRSLAQDLLDGDVHAAEWDVSVGVRCANIRHILVRRREALLRRSNFPRA